MWGWSIGDVLSLNWSVGMLQTVLSFDQITARLAETDKATNTLSLSLLAGRRFKIQL